MPPVAALRPAVAPARRSRSVGSVHALALVGVPRERGRSGLAVLETLVTAATIAVLGALAGAGAVVALTGGARGDVLLAAVGTGAVGVLAALLAAAVPIRLARGTRLATGLARL